MKALLHTRTAQRGGFSILEMLVAMAATVALVLFLNQIFSTISAAVRAGVERAAVIQKARVIANQLRNDTDQMVGPGGGGFLVITTGTASAKLDADDPLAAAARNVDHIAFVRFRSNLDPICPANDNTFSHASDAPFVRVWYGIGQRTTEAGADGGALGSSQNQYAGDWVLCRQALFLDPSPSGNYVNGATTTSNTTATLGVKPMYQATADICNKTLEEINEDIAGGTGVTSYTYGTRLWVNPSPSTGNFESWRIAQLHPLLAEGVSDVKIDYVADDGNGKPAKAGGAVVWTHGSGSWSSLNPETWPHLIRIRIRLHGKRADLAGADGEPGVVHEFILKVNRG